MAARSWLAQEAERLARLPSRPRWQEVRDLQQEGFSRGQIAEAMGIGAATVRFYECEIRARARDEDERYRGRGSVRQTAAMVRVYPDAARREWVMREMALRDELIEHKRRRGLL